MSIAANSWTVQPDPNNPHQLKLTADNAVMFFSLTQAHDVAEALMRVSRKIAIDNAEAAKERTAK